MLIDNQMKFNQLTRAAHLLKINLISKCLNTVKSIEFHNIKTFLKLRITKFQNFVA